jgi:Na+/citrate or Na+/malate symporter
MIGWVRNLIIEDCRWKVDNLVSKNIKKNSAEFFIDYKKKFHNFIWIIMSLLFVLNTNVETVIETLSNIVIQ